MVNRLSGFAVPPVRVVTPARKFEIELAKFSPFLFDKLDKAMRENANAIARETRAALRKGTRRGRRRAGAARESSAPGEPPRKLTGALSTSIKVRKLRGRKRLGYRIFSTEGRKSLALEFGAPRRQLAERPFLRPARSRLAKQGFRNVEQAIAEAAAKWARLGAIS